MMIANGVGGRATTQSWEELRRAARTAERHLEDKIAAYTAISRSAARVVGDYDVGGYNCNASSLPFLHS